MASAVTVLAIFSSKCAHCIQIKPLWRTFVPQLGIPDLESIEIDDSGSNTNYLSALPGKTTYIPCFIVIPTKALNNALANGSKVPSEMIAIVNGQNSEGQFIHNSAFNATHGTHHPIHNMMTLDGTIRAVREAINQLPSPPVPIPSAYGEYPRSSTESSSSTPSPMGVPLGAASGVPKSSSSRRRITPLF